MQGKKEYEIKKVFDARETSKGHKYLVSQAGYSAEENSQKPVENLQNCQQVVKIYYQQHLEALRMTNQGPLEYQKRMREKQEEAQAAPCLYDLKAQGTLVQIEGFSSYDLLGNPTAYEAKSYKKKLQQQPEEQQMHPVSLYEQQAEGAPVLPLYDNLRKHQQKEETQEVGRTLHSTLLQTKLQEQAVQIQSEQCSVDRSTL